MCKLDKLELVITVYYFVNNLSNPFPPTGESKEENTVFCFPNEKLLKFDDSVRNGFHI